MLFYVNIYGSYKLSKNSPVFLAHPVYIVFALCGVVIIEILAMMMMITTTMTTTRTMMIMIAMYSLRIVFVVSVFIEIMTSDVGPSFVHCPPEVLCTSLSSVIVDFQPHHYRVSVFERRVEIQSGCLGL